MDNLLERVSTFHQAAMGAVHLPLELQQQVYSYLDTRSFHAARNVCKWWRFASLDAVTLSRQLRKLPVLPPVDAHQSSSQELQRLWSEAAHTLMLGTRVQRQLDLPLDTIAAQKMGFVAGLRVTSATNGTRKVTINNRMIAIFDTSDDQPMLLMQRPLNELKETMGSGPWLRVMLTSYYELALSANGRLLAVAQERTVQIYDLFSESDSFTVNENIVGTAGHYICGLDFEQNDCVLRVRLSGKGTVLYLGSPANERGEELVGIEHWRSRAGLGHTFLDTSVLALDADSTKVDHARLSGLQVLRPWQQGFLFAAQRHGGNESSHYVLGHIRCSFSASARALTADAESVTILARLESFLSAWDYTLNGNNESGMGVWENMPSAHEHHPTYALSPDGTMIVVAERDKKAIRPVPLTQLFLYSLPNERRMRNVLEKAEQSVGGEGATFSPFQDKLETRTMRPRGVDSAMSGAAVLEREHKVARLPICLSTIRGTVNELKFEKVVNKANGFADATTLTAVTTDARRRWNIAHF